MSLKSMYEERKKQNLNIDQVVQENQMLLETISMLKKELQQKSETIVRQNEEIVSRNETIVRQNEEIVSKNEEIVRLNERIVTLNESDLELKKAEELNRSSEEILQRAEVVRKQYDRDSKRVEELRSELRELRIERENTAKKLQEDREELFLLNADKIHAEYEKCLTRAMRRILDSHACMIESRKPLFGGKAGEVLVDVEQLSELQDTARFWEGLQEQNRTLQEKLIRENNRCHDLETKLSVQADDIKRKRELIEELGELIMAEKGFTTNEEYVEWYLKNRKTSQN